MAIAIAGRIERLDAIAESRQDGELKDLARDLRNDVVAFIEDTGSMLDGQKAEQFRQQVGDFAPRLSGEDPWRPNPQTQPGNPNPTPESEAAEQEAFEKERTES